MSDSSIPQQVTILGATGSIGCSTLDVIARHPDRYQVFALSGHRNLTKLADQIVRFRPQVAVVPDNQSIEQLRALLPAGIKTELACGEEGLEQIAAAPDVDMVMAAIVGAAGLKPNLAAAAAGKKVLLANKESLVTSGQLFMDQVAKSGATLLPIDSEHNAIFQCLPHPYDFDLPQQGLVSILLTASGGPFRQFNVEQLQSVTPEQACAHPNWDMGRKISVDSASLMNKGLELIEACWLFDVSPDQIEVVIHPQSIIHSMVRYQDGTVLAQMGNPDMRTPIAYGLAWPERIDSGVEPLDFNTLGNLSFEQPDEQRFPCLRLAREAFKQGGTAGAILNAANEVSVQAFLDKRISFTQIGQINERVLNGVANESLQSIEQVLQVDQTAREQAAQLIQTL